MSRTLSIHAGEITVARVSLAQRNVAHPVVPCLKIEAIMREKAERDASQNRGRLINRLHRGNTVPMEC